MMAGTPIHLGRESENRIDGTKVVRDTWLIETIYANAMDALAAPGIPQLGDGPPKLEAVCTRRTVTPLPASERTMRELIAEIREPPTGSAGFWSRNEERIKGVFGALGFIVMWAIYHILM